MQTANDLLKGILTILIKIDSKTSSKGAAPSSDQKTSASSNAPKENIFGMGESVKSGSGSFSDMAKGMGDMGKALKDLSTGMNDFRKAKGKDDLINFIDKIIKVANQNIKGSFEGVANSLLVLSKAMSPLSVGVLKFGIMEKIGMVAATNQGISSLITTMAGLSAVAPLAMPVALVLAGLGVALEGISSVLKSIGLVMLSFATSILILVGALKLTQMLFGVESPWAAMGMLFGIMGGFALMFTMLAALSPAIILGGAAMAAMGTGLILVGIGLMSFLAATWVMTKIGDWGAIFKTMAVIGLLALTFAAMGALSPLIIPGAWAAEAMGKSLIWLSIGLLAFNGVTFLLQLMDIDFSSIFKSIAVIGLLAITFAALGALSPLILMGSAAAIALSLGIVVLSLGLLAFTYLTKEISDNLGKDGINSMLKVGIMIGGIALAFAGLGLLLVPIMLGFLSVSLLTLSLIVLASGLNKIMELASKFDFDNIKTTISDLVSSTMIGVTTGITRGLLGEDGDSKGFFGKAAAIAKNTAILMYGIGLVMSTTMAVSMLGLAMSAFSNAGTIRTITGYDKEGKPIFGEAVDISQTATNIAIGISNFFTGLKDAIVNMPSLNDVDKITAILTGHRPGLFNDTPSLMGVIIDFGKMLSQWAQIGAAGGVPVRIDKNGKVLEIATFNQISGAIGSSISSFMTALSRDLKNLPIAENADEIAGLLGGVERKFRSNKPGLMDPLIKFAEVIKMFAEGRIAKYDASGKIIPNQTEAINYSTIATSIASAVVGFATTLSNGLATLDSKALKKGTEKISDSFELLNTQFERMIKNKSGIEKAAETIGKFANSVKELGTQLNALDAAKLADMSNLESSLKIEINEGEGGWYPGKMIIETVKNIAGSNANISAPQPTVIMQQPSVSTAANNSSSSQSIVEQPDWNMIAQAIGTQVASALKAGQFRFEFSGTGPNGVMYLEK